MRYLNFQSVLLRRKVLPAAAALWVAASAAGVFLLWKYEFTGSESAGIYEWPNSTALTRCQDRMTLLLFVHPNCPCTLSTIHQLEMLHVNGSDDLEITAVVTGAAAESETRVLQRLREFAPQHIIQDSSGRISETFGAEISGTVFLFDGNGQLRFRGGVTECRGHEGRCTSISKLSGCLEEDRNQSTRSRESKRMLSQKPVVSTPVYGCQLHACDKT